ncbi:MAG: 5-methyltetrahydropteroyltriglutamate--homocysteine methyltransferase [Dehalococcoidia bacterium]|nr:5-methyltetrahydropteroyltriglutamate--homocysteine methyltransferase [Dehalococcoidia bacterium]
MTSPAAPLPLLPTSVIGSYPQPGWLIDRSGLGGRVPPRVRAQELWRVPAERLREAQDDAALLAIRDMEDAGIDIITDGEVRRESYSNLFANALEGVDVAHPATGLSRTGLPDILPRVTGPIRRTGPVGVEEVAFLRAHTTRRIKATVPGPFTLSQQAVDEHYRDERAMALAYAEAVNAELRDLVAAGADVVQIDEPYLQARLDQARAFAVEAIDRAVQGITATTVLHTCFGYGARVKNKTAHDYAFLEEIAGCTVDQISIEAAQPKLNLGVLGRMGAKTMVVGVLDLGSDEVEEVATVEARIHAALEHLPPERLVIAPDCGMKYLSRTAARAKLDVMVEAARRARARL